MIRQYSSLKKISLYLLFLFSLLLLGISQKTLAQQYTADFSSAPTLIAGPYWIDTAQVTLGGQVYCMVSGGNGGWAYKNSGGYNNGPNIQYDCAATTTVQIFRKGGGRFAFYGAWLKYVDITTDLYNTPPFVSVTYTGSTDPNEPYGPNTTTVLSKNVSVTMVTINIVGLLQLNFDNLIVGPSPVILPTVTTSSINSYNTSSATAGGNVTDDGGGMVTEKGIVYNTTGIPTTSNTKIQMGSGTGSFSQLVTGLAATTKYYVRAYAINSAGTAYGSEVNFTTEGPFVLASTHNFNGGSWTSTTNQPSPYTKFIQGWNVTSASTGAGNASVSRVTGGNSADNGAAVRTLCATSTENLSYMAFKVSDGTHFDLQNFKFRYATRVSGTSFSNIIVTGYVNGVAVSGAIASLSSISPVSANSAYNTFDFSEISQFRNIDEFRITASEPVNSGRLLYFDLDLLTVKNIVSISSNAALTNLSVSSGSLSPTFDSATIAYAVAVAHNTTTFSVTPVTADSTATIKVNGQVVTSGSASEFISLNPGINVITVVVRAQDETTEKSYTITVTRAAASTNAALSGIMPVAGMLSPAFDSSVYIYTSGVDNGVTTYAFTPAVFDSTATIKVNGQIVSNDSLSQPISLAVGENSIIVEVTAQDGITVKTYTITVTRAASTNAALSGIAPVTGTLSPEFDSVITAYITMVGNEVTTYAFIPAVFDTTAIIIVNGQIVGNDSLSQPISLAVGENSIIVEVTAQDGITVKTYTITVTRAASTNAALSGIAPVTGTLSPEFDSVITAYITMVGNEVTTYAFIPAVFDTTAIIRVNGQIVGNDSLSQPISLAVGENSIIVEVTAQDGITVKSYTITVTRAASTNAALSGIVPGPGVLSPAFDSAIYMYTSQVGNAVSNYFLTPSVVDTTATIRVNGQIVGNDSLSQSINLAVGENAITVEVTAEDGITVRTYIIIVTRTGSSNSSLINLIPGSGMLSPEFDSLTLAYHSTVTNQDTLYTVTPFAADTTAIIKVNGHIVNNGSVSQAVDLSVGENIITIEVTAQDGTTVTSYSITVTRQGSANATIDSISFSGGMLTPAFDTSITAYTIDVDSSVTTFSLTPVIADSTATIRVNGQIVTSGSTSEPVDLVPGDNIVTLEITAQDGTTKRTYIFNVRRATSTLPVTLISFNADEKANSVEVSWTTANQVNIIKYVVEKSADGIHFIKAGEVISQQNITQNTYKWEDHAPFTGNNFYRLKPVDKNGVVNYSAIIKLTINEKNHFVKIFPNPLQNNVLTIQLSSLPAGKYDILLYNRYGQRVFNSSIVSGGGSAGKSIQLPQSLSTGIYYIELKNGKEKITKPVIID